MKTKSIALAVVLLSTSAYGQSNRGTYFCVTEWTAGGEYKSQIKRWNSVLFNPGSKFILNIRQVKVRSKPAEIAKPDEFDLYRINITEAGSDYSYPCPGKAPGKAFDFNLAEINKIITCSVLLSEYRFNIDNHRFLQFHGGEFLEGRDSNDSETPFIAGGTCTKIE